jgi:hypothetical protein
VVSAEAGRRPNLNKIIKLAQEEVFGEKELFLGGIL